MAVLKETFRSLSRMRITGMPFMLIPVVILISSVLYAQTEVGEIEGASWEEGRLVLEEITIKGELRTPQALFMMLKATPDLSNVLLERSFIEDVIRPVYPGAFENEPSFGAGREMFVLPAWVRYGSVAVFAGFSGYEYYQGNDEEGLVFGIIAGLDLIGNLILDLVGN